MTDDIKLPEPLKETAAVMSTEYRSIRVRIEGDGTSSGTRIVNAATGEVLEGVTAYRVEHRVGEPASAVIEVTRPSIAIECVAMLATSPEPPKDPQPGELKPGDYVLATQNHDGDPRSEGEPNR